MIMEVMQLQSLIISARSIKLYLFIYYLIYYISYSLLMLAALHH